jgi:hypothetical protein
VRHKIFRGEFGYYSPDPVGKIFGVRHRGGKQDYVNVIRQHDYDLLPNHSTL